MAYEPTVWKSGDVITSTKLNKLENGVAEAGGGTGGGALICNTTMEGSTTRLDKTVSEILDAFPYVVIKWEEEQSYDLSAISEFIFDDEDGYQIFFGGGNVFTAQNLNDYPTHN